MSQEQPKLYTTPQAADEIGISDSRLRTLIAEGKAHPVQQIGGTWMFDQEEVDRLKVRPKPGRKPK